MATVQSYTKAGVDQKFASRSNMTLVHGGGGTPDLTVFPDAKTGDVLERVGDGARWRVIAKTLIPIEGRTISVQGKTGVVTLTPSDIGAAPTTHTHTIEQITDLNVAETATGSTVIKRDSSGRATVSTPTATGHATTKAYVDNAVTATKSYVDGKVGESVDSTLLELENLNSVQAPGKYFQATNTYATALRNYPINQRAGHLTVSRYGGNLVQEYVDYLNQAKHVRTKASGSDWQPWKTIAEEPWVGTQAEYSVISNKDPNRLYIIKSS